MRELPRHVAALFETHDPNTERPILGFAGLDYLEF
jgi:hypothetical protein